MPKECLKCGHINEADVPSDLIECPKCGVIYEKYEAAIAPKALQLNIPVAEYARDVRRAEAERRQRAAEVQREKEALQLIALEDKEEQQRDAVRQAIVKPTVPQKEKIFSPTLETAPCRTCGGLVAIGAKACPHCGQAKPAPPPKKKAGPLAYGIALLLLLVFIGTSINRPNSGGSATPPPISEDQRTAAQVAIKLTGYRCDSINFMGRLVFKAGFRVTCNQSQYAYEIVDEGGRLVVRLD